MIKKNFDFPDASTLTSKSLYDDGLKIKGGVKSSLYRPPVPNPRLPSLDPLQPTLKVGRECYDSPSIICDPDVEQAMLASSSFDVPAPPKPLPELARSNSSLKKRRKQLVLQIFSENHIMTLLDITLRYDGWPRLVRLTRPPKLIFQGYRPRPTLKSTS